MDALVEVTFEVTAVFDVAAAASAASQSDGFVEATVTCVVSSGDGVPILSASQRVLVLYASWPVLQDAVLVLNDGNIKSAWRTEATNVSSQLKEAACGSVRVAAAALALCPTIDANETRDFVEGAAAVEEALSLSGILDLSAVVVEPPAFPQGVNGTDAGLITASLAARGAVFGATLTVNGARLMVLVADRWFWSATIGPPTARRRAASGGVYTFPFPRDLRVFVDTDEAEVVWVSTDGGLALILTPSYEAECGSVGAASCGYHPLTLVAPSPLRVEAIAAAASALLPSGVNASAIAAHVASEGAFAAANLSVSCPPLCPGYFPGSLPALYFYRALNDSAGLVGAAASTESIALPAMATRAAPDSDDVTLAWTPLAELQASVLSAGIAYVPSCVSDGYTDPQTGVCINGSNPLSFNCAYGGGSDCQPCPAGALCPGGYRLWTRPGYYAASETAGAVTPCLAPSEDRCVGWDSTPGGPASTACGVGYRERSVGCLSCAPNYYTTLDGVCERCPHGSGILSLFVPLLVFTVAVLLFAVANYAAIRAAVSIAGGTVSGGAVRSLQLVVWVFSVVQLVAQVRHCYRWLPHP